MMPIVFFSVAVFNPAYCRYNTEMQILLTNAGSYPRIGETPELQQLRRTIAAWERQQSTADDLRAAEDALVRAALDDQLDAGLDLVTDGQIRWYDPISHLAGKLAGVEINGLLRLFDTNFYFRQPVVRGAITRREGMILSEYEFARAHSPKPVKPVLTGPYTLARSSILSNGVYKGAEALTDAYVQALAPEVEALAKAGAEVIQVDEPAIVKSPAELPLLERALAALAPRKGSARLALHLSFGDPQPLYDRLQRLPVDILSLDFTYNPKLADHVAAAGSAKPLGLGLVDARNTRLEDAATVAKQAERILSRVKAGACYLLPSCGLEYLPRDRARSKLKLLAQVRAHLMGTR
jgi:5-methyltetrahydropteroyltriglutamate--homocysteine methyltransferase